MFSRRTRRCWMASAACEAVRSALEAFTTDQIKSAIGTPRMSSISKMMPSLTASYLWTQTAPSVN